MEYSPLRPKDKSFEHRQTALLLTSMIPSTSLIGFGLLAASFMPSKWSRIVAGMILAPKLLSFLGRLTGLLKEPDTRAINRGRMTCSYQDNREDLVVFLIGIRMNQTWKLTKNAAEAGQAMRRMLLELEQNPHLGCLGTESYVGDNADGSTTLVVQYWQSPDHLRRWAQSSQSEHYHPWRQLMKLGRETDELGFWHETFLVRGGEYETVYVNCPAFHLAAARGVTVEPAEGKKATMLGRLGKGKGKAEEWPEGFAKDADY